MSLSSSNVNSLLSPKPSLQKRRPSAQMAAEQGAQLLTQLGSNVVSKVSFHTYKENVSFSNVSLIFTKKEKKTIP